MSERRAEPIGRRRGPKKEDEERQPGRERSGPDPKIVIGVIAVVVILVVVAVAFSLSGGKLGSIAAGNAEKGPEGISFEVRTTSRYFGEWSGPVTVEIYYEDDENPVYTGKVDVNSDYGTHDVDYKDFIWGNGNYSIYAKAEGKEDYSRFQLKRVVTSLDIEWDGYADKPRENPEHYIQVNVTYLFDGSKIPRDPYPSGYTLKTVISPPEGSDVQLNSDGVSYRNQKRILHTKAGEYSITGTLTNDFCHPDSPYRTLTVTGSTYNSTYYFDAAPFAVAGEDKNVQLTGGEAVVTFDGSDSWDDGTIVEYKWSIFLETGEEYVRTSQSPQTTYAFAAAGSHFVTLLVTDNTGKESIMQTGTWDSFQVTVN
ncbi:MAG: PKD domain-containing protein [Thermoplasmatota archaeon]